MSEQEKLPEPWQIDDVNPTLVYQGKDGNGAYQYIADFDSTVWGRSGEDDEERARLACEAVNTRADIASTGDGERMKAAVLARLWKIQSERVADETPEDTMKIDALLSAIAADLEQVEIAANPSLESKGSKP